MLVSPVGRRVYKKSSDNLTYHEEPKHYLGSNMVESLQTSSLLLSLVLRTWLICGSNHVVPGSGQFLRVTADWFMRRAIKLRYTWTTTQ